MYANGRPKVRYLREVFMRVKDGETIREARISHGYTQRNLAHLCRCSQAAIWKIENGQLTTVSEDLGKQLAKWLGLTERALFIRSDAPAPAMTTAASPAPQISVA